VPFEPLIPKAVVDVVLPDFEVAVEPETLGAAPDVDEVEDGVMDTK